MFGKEEIEKFLRNPQWKTRVLKYMIYVSSGDFNRNHVGPTPVPPDMLAAVSKLKLGDFKETVETYYVLLAMAKQAFHNGDFDNAIAGLDECNAFIYGLMTVIEIRRWPLTQLGIGLEKFIQIEPAFVETVMQLKQHGLTQEQATETLRKGRRQKNIVIWPIWIDDLLLEMEPSAKAALN